MASRLQGSQWFKELEQGDPRLKALYEICDIMAPRVIYEEVGRSAPKNERNWPTARICRYVGNLCMRYEVSFGGMLDFVTKCHELGKAPPHGNYPADFGMLLVEDALRRDSGGIFSFEGRRRLCSLAKELSLPSADLIGAVAYILHQMADELASSCGEAGTSE